MEEGLESHELVKEGLERREHAEEHGKTQRVLAGAILAAILAVLAALGSLLSGNAANRAILAESKASDQWAYYQAESTKQHLYEAMGRLAAVVAHKHASPFKDETKKYAMKKGEIQSTALSLEEESKTQFERHHRYAIGVACFQVGIVMASISILVEYEWIYWIGVFSGAIGAVYLLLGFAAK